MISIVFAGDDADSQTDGEELERARAIRMQEVKLKPVQYLPTDTETEVRKCPPPRQINKFAGKKFNQYSVHISIKVLCPTRTTLMSHRVNPFLLVSFLSFIQYRFFFVRGIFRCLLFCLFIAVVQFITYDFFLSLSIIRLV